MNKIITGALVLVVALTVVSEALTLKESVATALKNNPAIMTAQKNVDAANARLAQAVGAFLPTLKLDASYSRAYTEPSTVQVSTQAASGATTQTLTFGTADPGSTTSWQASLSQPLFVAALAPGYGIASRSADISKAELTKVLNNTTFDSIQAYYGVITAEQMLKLAQESKEMAKSHLDQVTKMVNAGVATQADYLRTEVRLANAEVDLTRAKNALELAQDTYNNVLGLPLGTTVDLDRTEIAENVPVLPAFNDLLSVAYTDRPDWRQFQYNKKISEDSLTVARTALLPTVMLSGQTGDRLTSYPSYSSDVNSWTLTGAASWTLFDGLGIQNRIREAAANLDSQKANELQVKNAIALDVRSAYLGLKTAVDSLGSNKKAIDAAAENFKVATRRYDSGAGMNIEVVDAQVALTSAKVNYAKALFELEVGKAKINKAIGREML